MQGHREDRRRERLKRAHRCVSCSEKLSFSDIGYYLACAACRPKCKTPGCGAPAVARGLCRVEYQAAYRAGIAPSSERERIRDLVWRLYKMGKTVAHIAGRVDRTPIAVADIIRRIRDEKLTGADLDGPDDSPKCRGGLRLPCNNCLPTIYQLADQRRGSATFPATE